MIRGILRRLGLLSPPDHFGSAGWGTPGKRYRRSVSPSGEHNIEPGAFVLGLSKGSPVVLPRTDALRHGIIVGGSGSGKSRGFFLPNAALTNGLSSLVCTDPKSELWRETSGLHLRPERYAPTDPSASSALNWVPLCQDARMSELLARAIVESGNTQGTEQAWLDMEAGFLSGVFAHASTLEEPTPLSAYRLITRQRTDELVAAMLISPSDAAREQAMVFSQTQERMRGSILPVVAARLQWMRDESIARFTSASLTPPDFSVLRRRKTAVYWCLREQDIGRLRPLTSLFFTLLLEQLAHAGESGEGISVRMLLDEFANVGTIPGFETTITLARGRGVSLWLGIQSLSQLEARYGRPNAQTILANCGTKIALSGLDVDSAEYFSRSLGDRTTEVAKTSRHGTLTASYSYHTDGNARRLLTPDEVRRLGGDEALVIVGSERPMRVRKLFYQRTGSMAKAGSLGEARSIRVEPVAQAEPPPMPDLGLVDPEGKPLRRRRLAVSRKR